MKFAVLALDYDGTIARDVREAIAALILERYGDSADRQLATAA